MQGTSAAGDANIEAVRMVEGAEDCPELSLEALECTKNVCLLLLLDTEII